MDNVEKILIKEREDLKKILNDIQKQNLKAPSGRLKIKVRGNKVEYYIVDKKSENKRVENELRTNNEANANNAVKIKNEVNSKNKVNTENSSEMGDKEKVGESSIYGRYLRKKDWGIAAKIAQRDYDEKTVNKAKKRIEAIDEFLLKYKENCLKDMYDKTNIYRRNMIDVKIISDKEFIRRWQTVEYKGKPIDDVMGQIITNRGERVRSKSEKIIADKLYSLGIPYRYEYPLRLCDNTVVYPDFTILKIPERKEVYLEHFGMMDSEEYVKTMVKKLRLYEKNGMVLGVSIFFTQETRDYPLNTKALTKMLTQVFCVN